MPVKNRAKTSVAPNKAQVEATLRDNALLRNLTPVQWQQFLSCGHPRHVPTDTMILWQGRAATAVFIVLSGTVKVFCTNRDRADAILAVCGAGELLGEISAVDGEPISANVATLEPSLLWVIETRRFSGLSAQHARNVAQSGALHDASLAHFVLARSIALAFEHHRPRRCPTAQLRVAIWRAHREFAQRADFPASALEAKRFIRFGGCLARARQSNSQRFSAPWAYQLRPTTPHHNLPTSGFGTTLSLKLFAILGLCHRFVLHQQRDTLNRARGILAALFRVRLRLSGANTAQFCQLNLASQSDCLAPSDSPCPTFYWFWR